MNAVVQKLLQEKPLHYTVELSFYVSCCQYHIYGSIVLLEGWIEPADTSVVKNEMENDISDQKNSKITLAVFKTFVNIESKSRNK